MPADMACVNLKKDLDEVNISLFSAVSSWMKKHGKVLRPKLTEEQKKQLLECFDLMDADGSGAIDSQELGNAFKLLGLNVSKAEMKELLSEVDRDGSGELEFAEFLEVMTSTLKKIQEKKQDHDEQHGSPVPFALMATAYRRKRMMEGLLSGDKEVKQQMVQMADERQQQQQQQQQQAASQPTQMTSGRHSSSKPSAVPTDASSDAAPSDSGRSNHSTDGPRQLARPTSARLQQLPGEFFSQIKQRVGLRRSGSPDSLIAPSYNEELKAMYPDHANVEPLASRPQSAEPGGSSSLPNSGRISPGMMQLMNATPDKMRVSIKLQSKAVRRSSSLPSTGEPDMQLGDDLEMSLAGLDEGDADSSSSKSGRSLPSSAHRGTASRSMTPQSPKLAPLMKQEQGLMGQPNGTGFDFAGVSGRATPPVPRPPSPCTSSSSRRSPSRNAGQQQQEQAAVPAQSTFVTASRASSELQAWRSSSDARQSLGADGAANQGSPGSGRSSHSQSNRSSLELPAIATPTDTNIGAQQYGKLAAMLRVSNTQTSGWASSPSASAGLRGSSSSSGTEVFWSSSQLPPMNSRASFEQLHIMPGAAAAAAAAAAFGPSAGRRSKHASLELERSSMTAGSAASSDAAGSSLERRSLNSMWSFGKQPASNSGRRSIGNQLAAAGGTSGGSRARSSLDMSPPVLTGPPPLSSAEPRNLRYDQIMFSHELYSWPSNNRSSEGLPKGSSPGH